MTKLAPLRLVQTHFNRKRFVFGETFSFLDSGLMYQVYNNELKKILEQTTYNILTDAPELVMKFVIYPEKMTWQAAFDVVGVPHIGIQYKDFNQLKVLKCLTHFLPWQTSLDEIHQKSLSIFKALVSKEGQLKPFYQIVIYGNNLELHFFN